MTETKEPESHTEDKKTNKKWRNEETDPVWGVGLGILLYVITLFLLFKVARVVLPLHENPYDNPVFGWLLNGCILPCIFAGRYFLWGRHCEEEKKVRERAALAGLFAAYFVWLFLTAAALHMGFVIPRYTNGFAGYFMIILFMVVIEWHFERRWSRDMLIAFAGLLIIGACLAGAVFTDMPAAPVVMIPGVTDVLTKEYQSAELGVSPSVERYDIVVFDIPSIQEEIENSHSLNLRMYHDDYLAELESLPEGISGQTPDARSYTGSFVGVEGSTIHLSVSDVAVLFRVTIHGTEFFIETTGTFAGDGRLLHVIYSSHDTGWSKKYEDLDAFSLFIVRASEKEMLENPDAVHHLTEEELDDYPVLARILRYGGYNHNLSNQEAGAIRDIPGWGIVEYRGYYYQFFIATESV
jgi:hypothetical protein